MIWQAFSKNPASTLLDRRDPFARRDSVGQLAITMQDPNGFTVRIPFTFLGQKVAVAQLMARKHVQSAPSAFARSERNQRIQDEGRIAEPKPLVRIRARINFTRDMQENRCHRLIIE